MSEIGKKRDEIMRQLVELATRCGRNRWSAQTGYLHHCYNALPEEKQDTIPVVENALFAFALFQTRTVENISEGKALLSNLLHFQNAEGNFPIYLHESPNCKDRFLGVGLLPVFYWTLKLFSQILGDELKKRLENAFDMLLKHCLKTHREKPGPYHLAIKIAAAAHAMEISEGSLLLSELQRIEDRAAWCCPAFLADILIALQMAYPSISQSPWNDFWTHLSNTWHMKSRSYIGPPVKEQQEGLEPQPTLYDLFLGYFTGGIARRALTDHLFHLQAPLIRPTEDRLVIPSYPFNITGQLNGRSWHLCQTPSYAYHVIEKKETVNPATENTQHILRIVWGDGERTHTFACQAGDSEFSSFQIHPERIDIYLDLTKAPNLGDREKSREFIFYCDVQENMQITVNGIPSNTFQLGDLVKLSTGIGLQFSLEKGEGRFFGHAMRGNRPAQLPLKGVRRFDAYDWQFFLRTLHRQDQCRLKASIMIDF